MSRAMVTTENDVKAACLEWLNTLPGVRVWRQNTGSMISSYTRKRDGVTKTRRIRFGEPGQSDITGLRAPHGTRIEIEIKKPGETPTFEQNTWMDFIVSHGGISFWCDSLRSCEDKLKAEYLRRGWAWSQSWEVW